jgi:hypothetical protein
VKLNYETMKLKALKKLLLLRKSIQAAITVFDGKQQLLMSHDEVLLLTIYSGRRLIGSLWAMSNVIPITEFN